MKILDAKKIRESANHLAQLEITGAGQDLFRLEDLDLGPNTVLVRVFRDGSRTWEIVKKWIGELLVANMHIEEPEVRSAWLHERLPENAPRDIWREWHQHIMVILGGFQPALYV